MLTSTEWLSRITRRGTSNRCRKCTSVFLKLPAPQRKIIREVILAFAKVHADLDTPEARGKD
ncbi:MAG: hypothetical protein Q8K05_10385 [Polaromonas sp.]|uniref:hypothetical protein n=1 Tax=Polaromonas sp. TaxID=1869339 RepID=UPI0027303A80|nr:hypothetical protein [Polaromonas sp.]MDP2256446.1 hypothetical protein [Polaromonas sp.]